MPENKMREAITFPIRWFEVLGQLDEHELKTVFDAIGAYVERGEEPGFTGLSAALWVEMRSRIDSDRKRYEAVCARNRRNIAKRWNAPEADDGIPPDTKTYDRMPPDTENTNGNGKGNGNGNGNGEDISQKVSCDTFSPERRQTAAPGRRSAKEKISFDYDGDARIHGVTPGQLAVWEENFPALDVSEELRKATVWLDANRKQRKHDVKRFLASWLARAQDRVKSPPGAPPEILTEGRRNWSSTERGM